MLITNWSIGEDELIQNPFDDPNAEFVTLTPEEEKELFGDWVDEISDDTESSSILLDASEQELPSDNLEDDLFAGLTPLSEEEARMWDEALSSTDDDASESRDNPFDDPNAEFVTLTPEEEKELFGDWVDEISDDPKDSTGRSMP